MTLAIGGHYVFSCEAEVLLVEMSPDEGTAGMEAGNCTVLQRATGLVPLLSVDFVWCMNGVNHMARVW